MNIAPESMSSLANQPLVSIEKGVFKKDYETRLTTKVLKAAYKRSMKREFGDKHKKNFNVPGTVKGLDNTKTSLSF